jgi:crossover junction endodeoxyribonuclease RuvC
MRVLGIDPGLATTGYAVVGRDAGRLRPLAVGVIRTAPGGAAGRLAELRGGLAELIARHNPDVVAIERLFFNNNVRTAMAVGQASGVALLAAAEAGLEVVDYTPSQVKKAITGVGDATKAQVQTMVASLLKLPSTPSPPDAADACALAICHLNSEGLARAVARVAT